MVLHIQRLERVNMVWLAGQQFKPTATYEEEVTELQRQIDALTPIVSNLLKQHEDLLSGNAQIIKEKVAQADAVIVEQHKIKDRILNGLAELEEEKKSHNLEVQSLQSAKTAHQIKIDYFNETVRAHNKEITDRKYELDALDVCLRSLEKSLNDRQSEIITLEKEHGKKVLALKELEESHAHKENGLKATQIALDKIYGDYVIKNTVYMKAYAELVKEKQDFEILKKSYDDKHHELSALQNDVNKKLDYNNSAVIQNAKVLADTKEKIAILRTETQKHQEAISYLTNLKSEMVKQGESNEKNIDIEDATIIPPKQIS